MTNQFEPNKKSETDLGLAASLFGDVPLAGVGMGSGTAYEVSSDYDRPEYNYQNQANFYISGSSINQNQELHQVNIELGKRSIEDELDIFELKEYVNNLFEVACFETFEDGMESAFAQSLEFVIKDYDRLAIYIISRIILQEQTKSEVLAEALVSLGNMDHKPSYKNRLRLLEKSLKLKSRYARDAAAIGISMMDDPSSLIFVIQAIERESVDELRKDLQKVANQLEITKKCLSLSE